MNEFKGRQSHKEMDFSESQSVIVTGYLVITLDHLKGDFTVVSIFSFKISQMIIHAIISRLEAGWVIANY